MTPETLKNDPGFRALIARFATALPARAQEISEALAEGDLEALRLHAHRLKGAGGSYGFDEITSLARVVEHFATEGDASRLGEAAERLSRACLEIAEQSGETPTPSQASC